MQLNTVCSKTIAHILAYLRGDFLKNTKKVPPETSDVPQSLGNNLKKARQNAGLSQEDVAEKLYYTRQAISRWELEKTSPNIYVLIRLAKLYKVDLNTIVTGIKLPEKRKIFYPFALFGVLAFNSIFGLALLTLVVAFFFTVYVLELNLLFAPFISISGVLSHSSQVSLFGRPASAGLDWWQILFIIIMLIVGFLLVPFLLKISKFILHWLLNYFKYNIKSIYH